MHIAIFYEHALMPGGAPVGIRNFAAALAADHQVTLYGRTPEVPIADLGSVNIRPYSGLSGLLRALARWRKGDRPDVLLIVGYFLEQNALAAVAAKRCGIRVVLHPMGQVWNEAFRGKIFTQGCDVRKLEAQKVNVDGVWSRIADQLSPLLKGIYRHTAGSVLVRMSDAIAVLSDVEMKQFQNVYERPDDDFVMLQWGIDDPVVDGESAQHFYRDVLDYEGDRPNFIVWSRLDWYYKGLDRLLNGVLEVKRRQRGSQPPFRLFLCGPDYREGSVRVNRFIQDHDLDAYVQLLLPGSYEPGQKQPLRDADASLLFSRWDGSPRALRESLMVGTPIMVSDETNFAAIAEQYRCGLVVSDADDSSAVADSLMLLSDQRVRDRLATATAHAANELLWPATAERFVASIRERLLSTRAHPALQSRHQFEEAAI